ncbi:right-handed parallel beta-helix repeat-containing protein [Aquimarina algiphila]|uniref:right-handed parallel beta-helix repeat-containing protein n=1 Tax=Aquimarina algiphila TaxID=2047982 RepID=UPI0024921D54|nr:right-handed parallel beta-helix repeat-containing protein [Aquimarina algiphila]
MSNTIKIYKKVLLLVIFSGIIISCKTETTSEDTSTQKLDLKKSPEEIPENSYLFDVTVNSDDGLVLRKEPNINAERITFLPYKTKLKIISFTNFFDQIQLGKNKKAYGQWVKVNYTSVTNNTISGYVFDDFLDYNFFKKEDEYSLITRDTVVVYNEQEFLDALSSQRVIIVDAQSLNFEKYFRTHKEKVPKYLITSFDDDEEPSYQDETYYFSQDYEGNASLSLFNYYNLEIRGKDKSIDFIVNTSALDVIKFNNCGNILLDNLNFYHKPFDNSACSGSVTVFIDCLSFFFQNVHFNGTGAIGARIIDSEEFSFTNCEFYKNARSAIYSKNGSDIEVTKSEFYNNNLEEIFYIESNKIGSSLSVSNCLVTDNVIFSALNTFSEEMSSLAEVEFKNVSFINNKVAGDFFDNRDEGYITFIDCEINNNISTGNRWILNADEGTPQVKFFNSTIKDNVDFYAFINQKYRYSFDDKTIEENIFDSASDTIPTKFNYFYKGPENSIFRNIRDLDFNKQDNLISYRGHLLNGLYFIQLSGIDDFFGFPLKKSLNYATGNFVKGKLEGEWILENRIQDPYYEYFLTYKEGTLDGPSRISGLKILDEGKYVNNKKEGVWSSYYLNGSIQNKIDYVNGKKNGSAIFYYRHGSVMEERTDINNLNGNTKYYFENGTLANEIYYEDGKINTKKSSFFDIAKNKKEAVAYEVTYQGEVQGEPSYNLPIDLHEEAYKDKVHIWYDKTSKLLLAYTYYKDGMKNGIQYQTLRFGKEQNKTLNRFYFKNDIKRYIKIFDSINNHILTYSYWDGNLTEKSIFKGEKNTITKYEEFKTVGGKLMKHGKHIEYKSTSEKVILEEVYENGEKM